MSYRTRIILGILIFVIGIGLFVAPLVVNYYNANMSYEVIREYDDEVAQRSEDRLYEQLEKARSFNRSLSTGIVGQDPFSANSREHSSQAKKTAYPDGFGENQVIGEVDIPKLEIRYPIYNGVSDEILAKGVGYLPSSSLPVGGDTTHTVLTAHRGQSNNIFFRYLDELEEGDLFYVKSLGKTNAYQVDQIKIVEPYRVEDLVIEPNEDYATLLTCDPYMVNTHRLLVRGTRIPFDEESDIERVSTKESVQKNFFRYWWVLLLIILLILLFLMALWWNKRRNRNESS